MAALVFIFVMDALHIGLRNNPFGSATPGYTLLHGPTINSLGTLTTRPRSPTPGRAPVFNTSGSANSLSRTTCA